MTEMMELQRGHKREADVITQSQGDDMGLEFATWDLNYGIHPQEWQWRVKPYA